MIQQLTAMREAVLLEFFLDIQKSYDALYWEIFLELLKAYGVGPRML